MNARQPHPTPSAPSDRFRAVFTLAACSSTSDGEPATATATTSSPRCHRAQKPTPRRLGARTVRDRGDTVRHAHHHHRRRPHHHGDAQRQRGLPGLHRDAARHAGLVPQLRHRVHHRTGCPMTETGPFYTDVQPGDLVYYNPMDSITIIYEETSSVPTLTKMGEVTSDLTVFENLPDNIEMRIELG